MNAKFKAKQLRALKGPIKWRLPDGRIIDDTIKDFMRRARHFPYMPLYTTPHLVERQIVRNLVERQIVRKPSTVPVAVALCGLFVTTQVSPKREDKPQQT